MNERDEKYRKYLDDDESGLQPKQISVRLECECAFWRTGRTQAFCGHILLQFSEKVTTGS